MLFTYLFEIQRNEVIRVISESHLFMVFPTFSLSLSLSLSHIHTHIYIQTEYPGR